ncbi:hypothetical protein IG631_10648 [Alternaria alternata]|nr:hypothetical protein IG631_10648 [Alternaria alternata]
MVPADRSLDLDIRSCRRVIPMGPRCEGTQRFVRRDIILSRLLILVQIAVVSGLATIFAFGNYLIGAATVYRLNAHLYSGKSNISVDPPVVQTSASWP